MKLVEALKNRRSIRRFQERKISRKTLKRIVELGTYAPNAGNLQTWRFLIIDSKEKLMDMKKIVDGVISDITEEEIPPERITYQNLFSTAPAALIAMAQPYESSADELLKKIEPDRYRIRQQNINPSLQSVSSAITQMLLAAHGMGIGTCWMTGPLSAKPELEKYLHVKPPWEVVAIIAIGYPSKRPRKIPQRKPLEEVLAFLE